MLHLYDTRTRKAQEISPMDGKTLRFYCCGPTVYAPAHIGNFRTFIMQDVFRRVVELGGTATTHVRNLTDVDDKTIRDRKGRPSLWRNSPPHGRTSSTGTARPSTASPRMWNPPPSPTFRSR